VFNQQMQNCCVGWPGQYFKWQNAFWCFVAGQQLSVWSCRNPEGSSHQKEK